MPPVRRPTLKDVAARAGLSVMVASYTFSRPERVSAASREKILRAAADLGYRPHRSAQSLRTGSSGLIGIVVSEHLGYAFRDPGATSFLSGVADACAAAGRGMVLLPTGGQLEPVAAVGAADVDGFVFWTTAPDDPALAAALATGLPIVVQGGPDLPGLTCLSIDDRAAARAIAAVALATARHPGVISFPTHPSRQARTIPLDQARATLPVTAHRLAGIRAAHRDQGLDPASTPCAVLTENNRQQATAATHELLAGRPGLDALICLSDEIALGALTALAERDRLEMVLVTGFDGSPEAAAQGIPTISQDLHDQGRQAVEVLLGRPAGEVSWSLMAGRRW
ncbi:LacI family DNA-binding transcriptional regulator [Enemella evansiae]|uniref:LacI family DNA-binding transcriptional regulator n=1 Tax=Enemella evansiae TaxID=2016499 RepID=UPI00105C4E73|nr:LacI family DNA-binding transcriptional regulator [Enemella evansiae]TDO87715.1 LacI family transcriptional regulator [Enemella evansiae]